MVSATREREASLAVTSPQPGRVADRLAAVRELAGFRVEPLPDRDLRDVYLDRSDERLRREGLALRLRWTDGGPPLLAVKGDERELPGGGVDRLEREAPWGREGLSAVEEVLAGAGLSAEALPGDTAGAPPLDRLRAFGWRVVQERRTRRRPRRLVRDRDGVEAGELVVDEVRFQAGGGPAIHRELEVEAAPGRAPPAGIVEALMRRPEDALRPWDHSKLATGRALEALLAEGEPDRWRGPDGSLTPAAYDRMAALLEGG